MDCFTGSDSFAENLIPLGAYFSASGIITFTNSKSLQKTFQKIPLDKLLIETDSPFLAPVPMRGKKIEHRYIQYTLNNFADLKNINNSKIDKITKDNFKKLFF